MLTYAAICLSGSDDIAVHSVRIAFKNFIRKITMRIVQALCLVLISLVSTGFAETLTVPATTAYFKPDSRSLRMTGEGVAGWADSKKSVVWFGWQGRAGDLTPSVKVELPGGETANYSLSISAVFSENFRGLVPVPVKLGGKAKGTGQSAIVSFGETKIRAGGYYRCELNGLTKSGSSFGEVQSLILEGKAVEGSQFNLTNRRNAASVHLWFPTTKGSQVQAFYNELTVDTDPLWSYYMACGFHRGYFGIQVNSPTERRIIFSVWDSGNEGIDRNKVRPEDRVQLLGKGEGVVAHGFGNEGTGGHSHLVYKWDKGKRIGSWSRPSPQESTRRSPATFSFQRKNSGD